jgi:hypothetical protein
MTDDQLAGSPYPGSRSSLSKASDCCVYESVLKASRTEQRSPAVVVGAA